MDLKQCALLSLFLIIGTIGCQKHSSQYLTALEKNVLVDRSATLTKAWSQIPVPFYISNNVPEEFVQPILDSFSDWEEVIGTSLFDYRGRTDSDHYEVDRLNVIYWDNERNENGYLGVTHVQFRGGREIVEGDIVFHGDPSRFGISECQDGKKVCRVRTRRFDIRTVALHEIGHFLGLGHRDDEESIMNPAFGMDDVYHDLDSNLVTELQSVYDLQTE